MIGIVLIIKNQLFTEKLSDGLWIMDWYVACIPEFSWLAKAVQLPVQDAVIRLRPKRAKLWIIRSDTNLRGRPNLIKIWWLPPLANFSCAQDIYKTPNHIRNSDNSMINCTARITPECRYIEIQCLIIKLAIP